MNNEDRDIDSMLTTFNTAVIETASKIFDKHRPKKRKKRGGWGGGGGHSRNSRLVRQKEGTEKEKVEPERSVKYKDMNNNIKKCMKKAKENWIGEQCSEIEENLRKNNGKKACQMVKGLTTMKQGKATTVQDRSGKCL